MALTAVILDTTPLGLATQRTGKSAEADACLLWVSQLILKGIHVYVPEVADYEVRRELVRSGQTGGIARLNAFAAKARYLPLTTEVMRSAADLWAQVRNAGIPTAAEAALDGDVIVVAQALSLSLPTSEFIIATGNVKHLSRLAPAALWSDIG